MTELIKSDLIVSFLILVVFRLAGPWLLTEIPPYRINTWRNALLVLTSLEFLSPSFWIFAILASIQLMALRARETEPSVRYALLLCAVPVVGIAIPGFGLVNYLFEFNYPRLLSLVVLLPVYFSSEFKKNRPAMTTTDKLLVAFVSICIVLNFRGTTISNGIREIVDISLDTLLPYWIISRSIRNIDQIRLVMLALTTTSLVLALAGGFEYVKHWLLYFSIAPHWDIPLRHLYLSRANSLRANASMQSPISLGYLMVIALGCWHYLTGSRSNPPRKRIIPLILAGGLFVTLSRGPWVGMLVYIVIYTLAGKGGVGKLIKLGMITLALFPLIFLVPGGEKVVNLLPFIGHAEQEDIAYRQQLVSNAWIVIQRNFLLGSIDFLSAPELQAMVQGQGIIDIVNTYLGMMLHYGLVGVTLFVGVFLSAILELIRIGKLTADDQNMEALRGHLLATLTAIMVMIVTVSPVDMIQPLYLIITALSVAFARLIRNSQPPRRA